LESSTLISKVFLQVPTRGELQDEYLLSLPLKMKKKKGEEIERTSFVSNSL
jgi:hypothetical protein